jgi:hypothetical protein
MITPKQVQAFRRAELDKTFKEAERHIDNRLKWNGCGVNIAVSLITNAGVPPDMLEELMNRYRVNGWRVTRVNDQHDGDYLHFVPAD